MDEQSYNTWLLLSLIIIVMGLYGGLGVLGVGFYNVAWILFLISVAALLIKKLKRRESRTSKVKSET